MTAVVCLSTPVFAENLLLIGKYPDQTVYVDATSAKKVHSRPGGPVINASAWVISDAPKGIPGTNAHSVKTNIEFDCLGDRSRDVAEYQYSGQMAKGALVKAKDERMTANDPMVPVNEGPTKKILYAICGKSMEVFMDLLGQVAQADTERKMASQPKRTGIQQVSNSDDEGITTFIDMSTIRRAGDRSSAEAIVDFSKDPRIRSARVQYEFQCASKQWRYTWVTAYKEYHAKGLVLETKKAPKVPRKWDHDANQGAPIVNLMSVACGIAVDFDQYDFYDVADAN